MYTEDDKNIKKNNKSNNSDNFYNNGLEYEDAALYDEPSEDDFYSEVKINNQSDGKDDKKLKKIFLIVIVTAVLGIILFFIALAIFNKDSDENQVEIKLLTEKIIMSIGEEKNISYEVVNAKEDIRATFKSKNPNVVTVDNNGKLVGVSEGDSIITISYKSGRKTKEKKFDVIVVKK